MHVCCSVKPVFSVFDDFVFAGAYPVRELGISGLDVVAFDGPAPGLAFGLEDEHHLWSVAGSGRRDVGYIAVGAHHLDVEVAHVLAIAFALQA